MAGEDQISKLSRHFLISVLQAGLVTLYSPASLYAQERVFGTPSTYVAWDYAAKTKDCTIFFLQSYHYLMHFLAQKTPSVPKEGGISPNALGTLGTLGTFWVL